MNGARRRGPTAICAFLALGLLGAASGCGGSSSASDSSTGEKSDVTIALVGDLTGGDAVEGLGGQAGAQTAIHKINAAGGIDGHMIKLKSYDTQTNVTTSQAVMREAMASNPDAATAAMSSIFGAATASIVASAQVPWVSTSYQTAGTDKLPYWFTTSPTSGDPDGVAIGAVNGLKSQLGGSLNGKRIAVEGVAGTPAVDVHVEAIQTLVKQEGGTIAKVIRDPLTTTSWASQAANVAAAHVDGVITIHLEPVTAVIAKALAVAGVKVPIVSSEGANSDTILKTINLRNFFVVRETKNPVPGTALYDDAKAAGVSDTNMANAFFGKAFAAVYVIAETLKGCGIPCSAAKFGTTLKAMGQYTVPDDALIGPLDFSNGQSGLTQAQLYTWNSADSKAVPVGSPFGLEG